jgi:peptide/nickel transport system substrate-binding protein
MDERELREWIARVEEGSLGRRDFVRILAGLGVAAPAAAQLLAGAGLPGRATAQPKFTPAAEAGVT